MSDPSARVVMTYELFGTAARELATEIAADGYRPDMIVALSRASKR